MYRFRILAFWLLKMCLTTVVVQAVYSNNHNNNKVEEEFIPTTWDWSFWEMPRRLSKFLDILYFNYHH